MKDDTIQTMGLGENLNGYNPCVNREEMKVYAKVLCEYLANTNKEELYRVVRLIGERDSLR
ncbi:MAG: hypothetical protein HYW24_04680 [Candidatus Aenigmarchaeota archaeon]|nr:hypothetical protein [Candidatus Aenigmarchaeota archaeon]